jgi:class 3 adenylate cyclase/tetratricopeptide (TPR) repeat protein
METALDMASWLRELGLGQYVEAFRANDVDADLLASLTAEDLREIGVTSVGHRRRLLAAIAHLGRRTDRSPAAEAPAPGPAAERRQLTVMFVDLVGSTALSARLDPEEMGGILRAYQSAVAGEVAAFEGHVAKFMGDGVLAYFGWPRAHEDEAERAVRAGLAVIEAVAGLAGHDPPLACRVGIATGLVVVGEPIGDGSASEQTVVGDTPNLAARLQALAGPGQVLVARSTRRLLGAGFDVRELGDRALKGIDGPVPVFAVNGERVVASRFEARAGHLQPMVGREREFALLLERWRRARDGAGQAVLLVGEAGHGKSRIVHALGDALAGESYTLVRLQGSPYHAGSALWPVIQQLRDEAGFADGQPNDVLLDRLEALPVGFPEQRDALPLIAELLGLDGAARYGRLELTPQARRARTREALADRLLGLARSGPLLVVVEDAHWLDPTTRELIATVLAGLGRLRLLVLITSRPEGLPEWGTAAPLERLALDRLGRAGVEAIIRRLGGDGLPAGTIETIVGRTDGVPLFVEELTKAVLESDDAAVPASLHDSLMARLDRLPEAKELAQVAACIGRELDQGLLAAVAGRPAAEVERAIDRLVRAELVFRQGPPAEGRLVFKHALVRDAAYESLLRSRRREVHGRIARVLADKAAGHGGVEPQLVARHFLAADEPAAAMPHLLPAIDAAIARAAAPEARELIETGLAAVGRTPADETATGWRAKLHLLMGDSVRTTLGTAAPATAAAYRSSRLAYAEIGDQDGQEMALFGEFLSHFNAARLDRADEVAGLLRAAPSQGAGPAGLWHRHEAAGILDFVRGRFAAARRHLEALPEGEGPYPDRPTVGRIYLPWSLLVLGYPDEAARQEAAHLQVAAGMGRKFVLAAALGNGCYIPCLTGRMGLLSERASRCLELCRNAHLTIYENIASVFVGWLAGKGGDAGRGDAMMAAALAALDSAAHHIELAYLSSLRADVLQQAGRIAEARALLEQGLARNAATGEGWFDAELHRLLAGCADDAGTAGRHLDAALEISRGQEAKLWELRAARDLARLRAGQGRRQEALDLLAPVLGWFTEGFALPDLVESRKLLETL